MQAADQSTPPAMPTSGDMYIVGVSPTGDWTAQENALARYSNSTWRVLVVLLFRHHGPQAASHFIR
nr:DUF2793 domain-containing protein [Sulfitobacter donghicola]